MSIEKTSSSKKSTETKSNANTKETSFKQELDKAKKNEKNTKNYSSTDSNTGRKSNSNNETNRSQAQANDNVSATTSQLNAANNNNLGDITNNKEYAYSANRQNILGQLNQNNGFASLDVEPQSRERRELFGLPTFGGPNTPVMIVSEVLRHELTEQYNQKLNEQQNGPIEEQTNTNEGQQSTTGFVDRNGNFVKEDQNSFFVQTPDGNVIKIPKSNNETTGQQKSESNINNTGSDKPESLI